MALFFSLRDFSLTRSNTFGQLGNGTNTNSATPVVCQNLEPGSRLAYPLSRFAGCIYTGGFMVLRELDIKAARVGEGFAVPAIIAPLVDAATHGRDLAPAVDRIVQSLGFNTFMYGLTTVYRPGHDSLAYVFTTASQKWVRRYDQCAYIEVDPRIQAAIASSLPYIWDQSTERGKSPRVDMFIDDAARHGICSGISFLLPDADRASVILSFNSSLKVVDDQRRAMLLANFGTMLTFGYYFHEFFMRKVVNAGIPSRLEGSPLTNRERECLTLAAAGLTTEEIAERLGIKRVTTQFHFDAIRTKLAAATRHEAIARAVHQGLIAVTP
jgi:LuxR family transcriptional activator of conjugal transfer of Ti plasmids